MKVLEEEPPLEGAEQRDIEVSEIEEELVLARSNRQGYSIEVMEIEEY